MSAHTLGPWHRNIKPASRYPTIFAGRCKHVAQVVTRGISDVEAEANCDLITAAPELLAALEAMVADAEDTGEGCLLVLAQARSAIAKARGGAA